MAKLIINCLGTLQITWDSEPAHSIEIDKVRALLVYLAVEADRPHRREHLAGLLWSDQMEERALHSLRQALSTLRKALEDDSITESVKPSKTSEEQPFLLITRDTVQFNPASDYWLDVKAYCEELDTAFQHYHNRTEMSRLNIRRLRKGLALYHGHFLDQIYLSGSALFEEWATLRREEFNRRAVAALALLAEYHERRVEYALARQAAARITELAPWEETAHTQVIRLLALDGQWSAAQAQYMTLRRYLVEELGVEPARETVALYEAVRLGAAQNRVLAPRYPSTRHNLPGSFTPFVGRTAELGDLADLFADPGCRLLTLLGPGGIGKTRLALEAAREEVGLFADGVFFIPLAAIDRFDFLVSAIAEALGFVFYGSEDPKSQLVNYLHGKELLLVLDSFEHLLPAQLTMSGEPCEDLDLLLDILNAAPGIEILITSRTPLNLRSECVLEIQGLDYPSSSATAAGTIYAAMELFEQLAKRNTPRFTGETERPAILRICQLLEGTPLAIELSAAWVRVHTCDEIARQINQSLDFLATSMRDMPERHRSMRVVFEHSWKLLGEEEQRVFLRLSAFRGGFSASAACRAAEATPLVLKSLAEKSLIRPVGPGRYDLHPLVRQFTAERLTEDPVEMAHAYARHAHCYVDFLASRNPALKNAQQQSTLAEIALEGDNIRAAWGVLVENGDSLGIAQSVDSLYHFCNIRSQFVEGIELFTHAARRLEQIPQAELVRGMVLARLGALALRVYRNTLAQESLERSREIFLRLDEKGELAFCLISLGGVALRKKLVDIAWDYAQESRSIYRELDNAWGEAYALYLLGLIKSKQAQNQEAKELVEASVDLCRGLGDQRRLIASLNILGDIACSEGDYEAAVNLFQESLEISQRVEDRYNMAMLLNNLASVYQIQGQYVEERTALEESLSICREIGDRGGESVALNSLGEMAVHIGEYKQAREFSREALVIARELQDDWTVLICLNNLGEAACGIGDYRVGEQYYREALHLVSTSQMLDLAARIMVNLAIVYFRQGQTSLAAKMLKAAIGHSSTDQEVREKAEGWLNDLYSSEQIAVGSEPEKMGDLETVMMEVLNPATP